MRACVCACVRVRVCVCVCAHAKSPLGRVEVEFTASSSKTELDQQHYSGTDTLAMFRPFSPHYLALPPDTAESIVCGFKEPGFPVKSPTAYIAYSRKELKKVLILRDYLAFQGIHCILDKTCHCDSPAVWFEEQLHKSDFVLTVVSDDFPHTTSSGEGCVLYRCVIRIYVLDLEEVQSYV